MNKIRVRAYSQKYKYWITDIDMFYTLIELVSSTGFNLDEDL